MLKSKQMTEIKTSDVVLSVRVRRDLLKTANKIIKQKKLRRCDVMNMLLKYFIEQESEK